MNRMYGQANEHPVAQRTNGTDRTSPASLELDCSVPWSRRKLAPRQHVFHQGDEQTHVYVVKSGFVRLYSLLNNGRCQVIGFKSQHDFVAFEYSAKHRFSAQAVTATELRSVPMATFFAAASGDPQFLLKLYNVACEDLSRAHDLVLTIAKRDAEGSIAAFMLEVDARAAARSANGDFVSLPMLRGDIANYLGLTNETVSRIFTHFKKLRLIEVRGRYGIRLIDRRALRSIAEHIPSDRKSMDLENSYLERPGNGLVLAN
ncbi:MAG: helix-turn-helix domain-containing protein [Rhizobiales bacterium]|nr:helix-turn-helix domain-containing protein [Hyphomicrobiales bacterium]